MALPPNHRCEWGNPVYKFKGEDRHGRDKFKRTRTCIDSRCKKKEVVNVKHAHGTLPH